jgi:DNA polymerase I-like protein with 3'-5' exonuclease and polymerase domains
LSADGKTTYTLDLRKLDTKAVVNNFRDASPLVGYDVKYTLKVLLGLDAKELPAVGHDVLVGAFLVNSLRREQTLTELAQTDLGYEGSPFEDLDADEVITRAPEIIAVIKALHDQQVTALKSMPKLPKLAKDIEWPVIPVLARMEYIGIELDTKYLEKFADEINDLISDYEQQIYGHADQEFNISSPTQLADILFDKLGLPTQGVKRGKTGYSTAATELDKLREAHPIINLITQYREVTKLKNTYIDTLPHQVDENSRMSPHGLSVATGMTRDQAVEFIDKYKALRKPLFDYIDRVKTQAQQNGYVETMFGRRRPTPDIHSSNFVVRQAAERAAINMPIQGTEADLMKLAMVKVDDLLRSQHNDCHQLLQIHDSILVECPAEVADNISDLLKDTMENVYKLPVRLDVDVTAGDNWGEL